MKIENRTIITYFKIRNNKEYVIYTKDNELNSIYISSVSNNGELNKLDSEELPILKEIIKNLISSNPDSLLFSKYSYQFISLSILSGKNIVFEGSQKIQLTDTQYTNLLNNRYLKYPYNNISTNDKKDNKKKNNDKLIITVFILLMIVGVSLYIGSNFIKGNDNTKRKDTNNDQNNNKITSGDYILCQDGSSMMYFELKNNKVTDIIQNKMVKTVSEKTLESVGKEYYENDALDISCSDLKEEACGNVKFSWDKNIMTMTFAQSLKISNGKLIGMTSEEMLQENSNCTKVSEAPIYSTKLDPIKTYYTKVKKYNDKREKMKEDTKSEALNFIKTVENYANNSKNEVSGYSEKLPIATSENVTCIYSLDAQVWSTKGTGLAPDACSKFFNNSTGVLSKVNGKKPEQVSIVIDSTGKVLNNTKVGYNGFICIYNGVNIDRCVGK